MKNVFSNLVMILVFVSTTSVLSAIDLPKPSPVTEQIQEMLKDFPRSAVKGQAEILIQLIVNADSEVVVLSTNNDDLDSYIKMSLNYQTIEGHNLEANKVYLLPVTLIKK